MRYFLNLGTEIIDAEEAQQVMKDVADNPSKLKTYITNITPDVISFLIHLAICIVVFVVGSRIIKTIAKIVRKSMEKGGAEVGAASFVGSLCKYSLDFVLIMLILSSFGLSGSIVAVLGSAGLTLGLALQGSLSNFAGGVLLVLIKPFLVGDYIIDHSCGKEGTVTEITIFYTKLLTADNKVVLIPNGSLSNATLTNVSRMDTRRVDLKVGVGYESDLSKVKAVIENVILKQSLVIKDQPIEIFVDNLADSCVEMGIHVWVSSADYFMVKWALVEEIKNEFDAEGISIPFPQMDVNLKNQK